MQRLNDKTSIYHHVTLHDMPIMPNCKVYTQLQNMHTLPTTPIILLATIDSVCVCVCLYIYINCKQCMNRARENCSSPRQHLPSVSKELLLFPFNMARLVTQESVILSKCYILHSIL